MIAHHAVPRRLLAFVGAAVLFAGSGIFATARHAYAVPYCDGSLGPECRSTRVCFGLPGTDVSICTTRYYYRYEVRQF
jgi:hypothetical protein